MKETLENVEGTTQLQAPHEQTGLTSQTSLIPLQWCC